MNTSLYNDLYKSTSAYKTNKAKNIISKFIFKKPTVKNTVGFNIIDPNVLYASTDNEKLPTITDSIAGKAIVGINIKNQYIKIENTNVYSDKNIIII